MTQASLHLKTRLNLVKLAIILLCIGMPNVISANPFSIQFIPPQTEEESDPRDRPRGGGSRPICSHELSPDLKCSNATIIALFPGGQRTQQAWGLTQSATPSIWFFSPYTTSTPVTGALNIFDENGALIWHQDTINLPPNPSFFAVSIPTAANLQPQQTYRWYFRVLLDPEQPSASTLLSGRIHYVPNNFSPLQSIRDIQQLAQNGYWYDTLTALSQDTFQPQWKSFLQSQGFEGLLHNPIYRP